MDKYQPSEILESIRKEDRKMLLKIYESYFPQVRHHILSNSGNQYDAEDAFQDAMVIIYEKVRNNTLILSSSFGTYLNKVARFIWYNELKRKRRYFGGEFEKNSLELIPDEIDFFEDYIRLEKRKLIMEHFSELNGDCKKILDLYLKETPLESITNLMGYSSDQYTRNRRTSCKVRLIRAIWNNPRFKELKNEAYRQDTKVPRW
jgi:RNA polymerase sigma factor (sigma-70 family)